MTWENEYLQNGQNNNYKTYKKGHRQTIGHFKILHDMCLLE